MKKTKNEKNKNKDQQSNREVEADWADEHTSRFLSSQGLSVFFKINLMTQTPLFFVFQTAKFESLFLSTVMIV